MSRRSVTQLVSQTNLFETSVINEARSTKNPTNPGGGPVDVRNKLGHTLRTSSICCFFLMGDTTNILSFYLGFGGSTSLH